MDEEGKFAAFKTDYYCYKEALVTARVYREEEEGRGRRAEGEGELL
jgi:hypothetical protein